MTKTLAIAMTPTKAGTAGSRRSANRTKCSSREGRRRKADNTVNSRTKDVCKSKDARKDSPPAAAIDTETSDSATASKHSRDASQSKRKDARRPGTPATSRMLVKARTSLAARRPAIFF